MLTLGGWPAGMSNLVVAIQNLNPHLGRQSRVEQVAQNGAWRGCRAGSILLPSELPKNAPKFASRLIERVDFLVAVGSRLLRFLDLETRSISGTSCRTNRRLPMIARL